jgi:predicted Zn-dependent protease
MSERINIFQKILANDPTNTTVLFGLAKEYEKAGDDEKVIQTLNRYLEAFDDEGNAFGMLAAAYERTGEHEKAREAYERGIETALRHGHPGMAEEYRMTLATTNYEH